MNIYLIPHATEPRFKIGKANDLKARTKILALNNRFDMAMAFAIPTPSEPRSFQIERAFHLLLDPFRLDPQPEWGDGATEWFSMDAFPIATGFAGVLGARSELPEKPRGPVVRVERRERSTNGEPTLESQFASHLRESGAKATADFKSVVRQRDGFWLEEKSEAAMSAACQWLNAHAPDRYSKSRAASLLQGAILSLDPLTDADLAVSSKFDHVNRNIHKYLAKAEEIEAKRGRPLTKRDLQTSGVPGLNNGEAAATVFELFKKVKGRDGGSNE